MKSNLNFQLKNALYSKNFLLVSTVSIVFGVVCFFIECFQYYKQDIINIPSAYQQFFANAHSNDFFIIFSVALPFLAATAFSDSYALEYGNNFVPICLSRAGKNKYFFSKMVSVFLCGAFAVMISQIVNLFLCVCTFPLESTYLYSWDLWQADIYTVDMTEDEFLFKELYIFSPYAYFLLFILISGILSGVIAVISFEVSLFIKNRIFINSFMFVFINLSNIYFEVYEVPYSISDYMFGLTVGRTYKAFLITCLFYIALMLLMIPLALRRMKNCV